MNNPSQSPLVPQGSVLEQKNKGRARVKIAVFFVLAVHGIGLLALLVQGCRQDSTKTAQADTNNAPTPPPLESSTPAVAADTTTPAPNVPTNPAPADPTANAAAPTAAGDYTIAAGDTFSTIGKKFHVTAKAVAEANPGMEPTRLRVGQKIHIPAATAAAPTQPAATAGTTSSNNAGEQMYTVKSGDTLSTIARQHATTVKAIRTANSLTTDRIVVGQKLKLPKGAAAAATAANDAPTTMAAGNH